MTSPGCGEHVREAYVFLVLVPRGSDEAESCTAPILLDEPNHHETVSPIGNHRCPENRPLRAVLRIGTPQQPVGLPNGNLDGPLARIAVENPLHGTI